MLFTCDLNNTSNFMKIILDYHVMINYELLLVRTDCFLLVCDLCFMFPLFVFVSKIILFYYDVTLCTLIHFMSVFPFYTPDNVRKPLADVFRGYRNGTLAWNGLTWVVGLYHILYMTCQMLNELWSFCKTFLHPNDMSY